LLEEIETKASEGDGLSSNAKSFNTVTKLHKDRRDIILNRLRHGQ